MTCSTFHHLAARRLVENMGEIKYVLIYKILAGKSEERRQRGRYRQKKKEY
jgi:hypothetical protein